MKQPASTVTRSPEETEQFAAQFATGLRGGQCLALHGELGAGKTRFVRGLVKGLNGDIQGVSSPTFVLLNIYDTGRLTVYHLDAYRTRGGDDMEAIGFTELLDQGGVVVIEWAERITDLLPETTIHIRLRTIDEHSREIEIDYEPRRYEGTKKGNKDFTDCTDSEE